MAVRLRCIRCRKVLGEDGKCHNKYCVLCVKEPIIKEPEQGETPIEAVKEPIIKEPEQGETPIEAVKEL